MHRKEKKYYKLTYPRFLMIADPDGRSIFFELRQEYGREPDGHPGTERHD
jgi:hypothetical protein